MPRLGEITSLIGQRFGCLTVKSQVVREKGQKANTRWNVLCDCGNHKIVGGDHLKSGRTQSCGCLQKELASKIRGSKHPWWRGGKRITDQGYVAIYSPDHPNAYNDGRVPEHRLVMETALGRYLNRGEEVHHKNGIRDDNRPENLELWDRSHPPGQRLEDKLEWAKDLLERHGYLVQAQKGQDLP